MTEAAVVGWGQAGVGGTLRVSSWPKNVLTALSCACTTIVYRMMAEVVLEDAGSSGMDGSGGTCGS